MAKKSKINTWASLKPEQRLEVSNVFAPFRNIGYICDILGTKHLSGVIVEYLDRTKGSASSSFERMALVLKECIIPEVRGRLHEEFLRTILVKS